MTLSTLALILAVSAAPQERATFDLRVPLVLNDDGAWCWFQDPRVIVHAGRLVVGSVAAGRRDPERRGDVEVACLDLTTSDVQVVELHDGLELDDHAAPAFLIRPDGRLIAVYARHGGDEQVRARTTVRPEDPTEWGPERTFAAGADVTYSNLVLLPAAGDAPARLLDFHRGVGWDPNVLESTDGGATWWHAGRLLEGSGRPYLKYVARGGLVHLVATEQHPRNFDNGIHHGILRDGEIVRSDGEVVGALGEDPVRPEELTTIFRGRPDAVAWTVDLELDAAGRPVTVFSVQVDGADLPPGEGGMDHRYRYAAWDGERWTNHELAYAGTRLYAGEDDYTGLAAIDPDDTSVVYVSTNAHPRTGEPLVSAADGRRHHELFRGVTADGGATWSWAPITHDSCADNLRPIVPRWCRERTALLWLRGEYRSYIDYDLEVVGLLLGD